MGRCLSRRLEFFLHSRAHPHDPAPGGGLSNWPAQDDAVDTSLVQARKLIRRRPSPRRRCIPAEIPARSAERNVTREPLSLLSALFWRDRRQNVALLVSLSGMQGHSQ